MTTTTRDDEQAVVNRLLSQSGDIRDDDLAVLYDHYKAGLVRHAERRGATDPEGLADLALFDGFRAIERLDSLTDRSFRSYLLRALNGHIVAEYRAAEDAVPTDLDPGSLMSDDPTGEAIDSAWLRELVEALPPGQREVIYSRFFLGLSGSETAALLGKEPNAVYQTQHRALKRLRQLALAGVLVLLVLLGALALRGRAAWVSIDSSPVGRTTTEGPPPAVGSSTPDRADVDQSRIVTGGTTTSVGLGAEFDLGPAPSEGQPSGAQPPDTDGPGASLTTTVAPSTTAPSTTAASTTSATTPSTTPPTTAATTAPSTTTARPAAATPLNVCAPHLAGPTLLAFKLYNPSSNHGLADAFNAPGAVRFLDDGGQLVRLISTSDPMTTSRTAASHGWIGAGDGTGTYASFDSAPTPTYWGVLVDAESVEGWSQVQWFDEATVTWSDVPNCS